MAIPARGKAVCPRRKMALRSGAGPTLPPAPSTHKMGTRSKVQLPASSVICPICLLQIGLYDDYLRCVNQCRKIHRNCFESWCGKPCLCKGLLCNRSPQAAGLGWSFNYLSTCANCMGPSYPQTQDAILQKWILVFASTKFKTYIDRAHGDFLTSAPIHGWKAFARDYIVLTNNDEHGRHPHNIFQVLIDHGDTPAQAFTFVWEMYRISRITYSQVPGAASEVLHGLTQSEYRKFFQTVMRKNQVLEPPFTCRYRYDRVLYFHERAISDGRDDPANVTVSRVRACNFSPLTGYMHTHKSSKPWEDFRRMFERPQADWGLWNS